MAEATSRRLVLVVDDELHLRYFLATIFQTAGYETVVARNGAEGLAKARERRPDLISLDLMMPGEGGVVLLRGLKADPALRQVPVIIVSAVDQAAFDHALALLRAGLGHELPGPDAFVPKPPDPQAVLAAAQRALAGPGGS